MEAYYINIINSVGIILLLVVILIQRDKVKKQRRQIYYLKEDSKKIKWEAQAKLAVPEDLFFDVPAVGWLDSLMILPPVGERVLIDVGSAGSKGQVHGKLVKHGLGYAWEDLIGFKYNLRQVKRWKKAD